MRRNFADEITKLAAMDQRIVLLSGDIGNNLFDTYKSHFPKRFYNCGIAEANMAGVAAGLAMCGLRPITYTIAPFNTTRCLEQIRNDICYHNLPVLIIGTGAGLSYASLGCTHHSCEDISFLRSIPNMTVLAPGDAMELRALLRQALHQRGPVYMRIGKAGESLVHTSVPSLEIGKAMILSAGTDLCLISTGNLLPIALATAALLDKREGIKTQIVSMHTVKPLDTAFLSSLSHQTVAILEEHSLIGGLSSAVAEWIVDQPEPPFRLLRFGTQDRFPHPIGSQSYLRDHFGLNSEILTKSILEQLTHAHISRNSY